MMPLDQIDAYLGGAALVAALAALGLGIGFLTGMFGVGGAFLMSPMMISVLGMDQSLVVGSSLCFTIGTATSGLSRHVRLHNVEAKTLLILAGGAACGAILGSDLHEHVRALMGPPRFKLVILIAYLLILLGAAALVAHDPSRHAHRRSLLQRIHFGPQVVLPGAKLVKVSLLGLVGVGLSIGMISGMFGLGGGVLLVPIMITVIGLTAHQAVGTGLGVVVFGSIVGTVAHASHNNVSLWVVMSLLLGSTLGVQAGAWVCDHIRAKRLRQYFAVVVLLSAVLVAADIVNRLTES